VRTPGEWQDDLKVIYRAPRLDLGSLGQSPPSFLMISGSEPADGR